eukprot:3564001-Pyramimonas_sp.AAC.1
MNCLGPGGKSAQSPLSPLVPAHQDEAQSYSSTARIGGMLSTRAVRADKPRLGESETPRVEASRA